MSVRLQDLELLDAVRDYTLSHPHPAIAGFRPAMRDWGDDWIDVPPVLLPATDRLDEAAARSDCHPLVRQFADRRRQLRWEQSYTREQGLVPEAMLDGYCFAEIIGKRGPFVSERIRAGIGLWGPAIDYPRHHHDAEEVYVVLAGSAEFRLGDAEPERRRSGAVVHVTPNLPHGFATRDELLVVFYLWQAGDLRQTSSFE